MSEWYLFAVFVFLLAATLVWFVKRTPRSQKKREEKSFEREAKLFKLYQNIEDLMDGFEEYVEELKRSLAKDTEELKRRVDALETQTVALRRAMRSLGGNFAERDAPEQGAKEDEGDAVEAERIPAPVVSPEDTPAVTAPAAISEAVPEAVPEAASAAVPEAARETAADEARQSGAPASEESEAGARPAPKPQPNSKRPRGAALNRTQKVRILHAEGMDAKRIAQELGLSQNEVNLVLQLDGRADASLQ